MRSNQEIASDIVKRHRFDEGEENTIEVDRSGLIGGIAEALTTASTPEAQRNRYDRRDRVKQEAMLRAAGLKLAAYRVRDPETDQWSALQFHMTLNDTIMGMLGEHGAKLFANFVRQTLGEELGMAGRSGWQPIATAPRDDTLVLLGFYDGMPAPDARWIAIAGWYEAGPADRCWYDVLETRITPTHWMPLASAPSP